jgi:DNA mismatch repair protein MSH3
MAIAHAVLEHLVTSVKCKTLFITHYPVVAAALEKKYPADLQNLHMGFREESRIDGTREITFLYRLTSGMATESFGIECARLAGLPEKILEAATNHSQSFQSTVQERVKQNR